MKLLLTSNGICNPTIETAFRELLAKPTTNSRVVFVPTAANGRDEDKAWLVQDMARTLALGWKRFDVIDIAAVTSLDRSNWWQSFELADALVFSGGNPFYLSYWLHESGLAEELPRLVESKIFVGASSGAMVACTTLGEVDSRLVEYGIDSIGESSNDVLGWFDGCLRPHYGDDYWTNLNDESLQETADRIGVDVYALDDDSALSFVDGDLEFVSEGRYRVLSPNGQG